MASNSNNQHGIFAVSPRTRVLSAFPSSIGNPECLEVVTICDGRANKTHVIGTIEDCLSIDSSFCRMMLEQDCRESLFGNGVARFSVFGCFLVCFRDSLIA